MEKITNRGSGGVQTKLLSDPALQLLSCATSGKLPCVSEPQFAQLESGHDRCAYVIGLPRG